MIKIFKWTLLLIASVVAQASYAVICAQTNNSLVGLMGLDSQSGSVYAKVASTTNECSCNEIRFVPSNTDTKMALSILLAAKLADKKVRIDLLNPSDCNTGFRVYVQ